MTEDMCAFYCGGIIAVCVAVQAATLMFEDVRNFSLWGAGIFGLTSLVVTSAHDWLGVSWRVLYGVSILYFFVTMGVGEYFSRRRRRRHCERMERERAEYERKYEAEFE